MLPIQRLAASQNSSFSNTISRLKSHPFWSSRLATRILLLLGALFIVVFWLAPPLPDSALPSRLLGGSRIREPEVPPTVWAERANAVRESFKFAYNGYEAAAFGMDELKPLTNRSVTNFNGWGVTIVDSLSTILLMDLKDEFKRALTHVEKMTFQDHADVIPFFETVIRYLGGLLSAHALTGNPLLLKKADDLGLALLPTFDSPSGLPWFGYNPSNQFKAPGWSGSVLLAEMGSCQMEYKYLAHLTGRKEYYFKPDKIWDVMEQSQRKDGLWSTYWSIDTGNQTNDQVSVGGLADSAYEYLLKQYLLTGKSEKRLLKMYLKAVDGVLENLVFLSATRDLLYVTDASNDIPSHKLEHLSCFFPGLLALGVETLGPEDLPPKTAELHRWAAEGIATTCALLYEEQISGVGPEEVEFTLASRATSVSKPRKWLDAVKAWERSGKKGGAPPGVKRAAPVSAPGTRDYHFRTPGYYLRPETLESIYIMWKVTKDPFWRARGWKIYLALEKHAKTKVGYASLIHVGSNTPGKSDSMPSYFMAETLKYLYLLFSEGEDKIPFNKWIFNTEAHPLPVFHWTEREKEIYGPH